MPCSRREEDDVVSSEHLCSPSNNSLLLPELMPVHTPADGLGLHTALGRHVSALLSLIPSTLFYCIPSPRVHLPDSSPLMSLQPSPVQKLAPASIITATTTKKPSRPYTKRQMSTGSMFTGVGTSAATAINFLKDVCLRFARCSMTDAEKLEEVVFDIMFKERFASMVPVVKLHEQLLAELAVDGVKIAPMTEFCARLKEAGVGQEKEGVWAFHAALPTAICLAVRSTPAHWDAVLIALGNIPQDVIDHKVEEHCRKVVFNASLKELNMMMHKVHVTPLAPSTAAAARPMNATVLTTASSPAAPNVAVTPAAVPGAGHAAGRVWEAILLGMNMQKGNTRQPKDNINGCACYAMQVVEWVSVNGHIPMDAMSIWLTRYPITPGTAILCSGECWKCSIATQPLHKICPKPLVPVFKRKYRTTCRTWLGQLHYLAQAVNYVEVVEVEGVPWYRGGGGDVNENTDEGMQVLRPGQIGGSGDPFCTSTDPEIDIVDLYLVVIGEDATEEHAGGAWIKECEEDIVVGTTTCEAVLGAKSCETPPAARRVKPFCDTENVDAAVDPGSSDECRGDENRGECEDEEAEEAKPEEVVLGMATCKAMLGLKSCKTPPTSTGDIDDDKFEETWKIRRVDVEGELGEFDKEVLELC
ncbi:hypothetical protein B0H17DRAFT_1125152 [Mycena rosella]|uniref:Uncharacterized protein n=1 Tax=Mycena rosella TaxID=1033263 RepID=A0AAD7GX88_MYCRO|nr:hypothetical protein B0H17DRAFT_1125152 [Mycena rosella]